MSNNTKPTQKESESQYSSIGNFFCRLGGADMKILNQVPTERGKLMSIGVGVLNTALTATVAMGFALYSIFNPNDSTEFGLLSLIAVVAISIFWGWLILGIDWGLVKSLKRKRNNWREVSFYLAIAIRLGLALVIARFVATPMEIQFFSNRTSITKEKMRVEKRELFKQEFLAQFKEELAIDSINRENARITRDSLLSIRYSSQKPETIKEDEDEVDNNNDRLNNLQEQINSLVGRRDAISADANNYEEIPQADKTVVSDEGYISYIPQDPIRQLKSAKQSQIYDLQSKINTLAGQRRRLVNSNQSLQVLIDGESNSYRNDIDSRLNHSKREYNKLDSIFNWKRNNLQTISDSITLTAQKRANDAIGNDIISNIEAMEVYLSTPDGSASRIWQWLIRALFIIIDLMPIVLKIMFPYGPYDRRLETTDIQEINLAEQELGLNIDLMSQMAIAQREIIEKEEGRIKNKLEQDFDQLLKDQKI